MRAVKLGIISIVALFILGTLMGLLLPSKVVVSRAIDIQAQPKDIKHLSFNLKSWPQWLPLSVDTSAVKLPDENVLQLGNTTVHRFSRSDSSFVTRWTSKSGVMIGTFNLIAHPNGTQTLHWQMVQRVGWLPWERMGTMMNDKILGPSMEKGLSNIKQLSEAQPGLQLQ